MNIYLVCLTFGEPVVSQISSKRQTRPHSDLDLLVRQSELEAIEVTLVAGGFNRQADADGLVYADGTLWVDLHPVRVDENQVCHFDLPDGGSWPFPPQAVEAQGKIGGVTVRCLSANAQVQTHAQGYVLKAKDVGDLMALQHKFGVVLPLKFYFDGLLG